MLMLMAFRRALFHRLLRFRYLGERRRLFPIKLFGEPQDGVRLRYIDRLGA